MKASALIPEDDLLLKTPIEAGASLETLAKGNKSISDKRKRGSICVEYYRKRRRIKSESFYSPDLSFFDKCKKLLDHATLNHEAQGGDAMFSDCLVNNFGSIATTDLVDKSARGGHESSQNDYVNCSMRVEGLYNSTENVCFLLRDNLISFFDPGIEPKDDIHMHDKGDSDNSSAVTEVEYASLLSFASKDYINCVLNTEDTIDDIPDSQLLDSPENVLEDPLFHGDQQDVCHCEDDVESTSISHLDPVHLSEEKITCSLNTEDSEIPCNDNILFPIHSSPYVRPQTATESIDWALSFTQSQMDGLNLSSESNSANPHVGYTLESVSMDHNPSIPDHKDSESDCALLYIPDIEDPEIICDDNILFLMYPSSSVGPQTATDSIDPATSFTQSQMYGPDLSYEFDSADPHDRYGLKSVSMDHNPSISDHNNSDNDSDLPCFPCSEDLETPSPPSVRPQTATDSIDPASCCTQSQMDDTCLSSKFDSANPHVICTPISVSVDHNPSILDHNSDSDLPCFPDTEDPEIPSPSIRPQTATDSSDPASSFTLSQMDDPDLSSEFDSAHPHVGNALKYVSVDHNPSISDRDDSDSDSDLPCFPDIEALILKLDFEYAQESWITNEVKRGNYKHFKRTINSLEHSSSQRVMSSLGAFAVIYSHHFNYYIKKTEVTIGRLTDDTEVDIDLRKECYANMISRQQATIKMETDGTFTIKNIGKGSILTNGKLIAHGQVAALSSSCPIQIRRMEFMFEINDRYVKWYLDNIMKKTQGKFTSFEWSVN